MSPLLPALLDGDGDGPAWLLFVGRLHVVVVHFPIALVVLAGFLEWRGRSSDARNEVGYTCLKWGTLAALAAVTCGWLLAHYEPPGRSVEDLLERHEWLGFTTAGVALAALWFGGRSLRLYRWTLLVGVVLVGWTGHVGGTMVHGEGFLMNVFEDDEEPAPVTPNDAPPREIQLPLENDPPPEPVGVDFARDVRPILAASCFKCHGRKKQKGGLRFDDMAVAFEHESPIIVPGDPDASELIRRVSLPAEDDDVMPSTGDPLTTDQIELLRRWVAEGAEVGDAASVEEPVKELAVATEPVAAPSDDADVERAFAALRAGGAVAEFVADGDPHVAVSLSFVDGGASDETLALLDGLEARLVDLDLSRSAVTDDGVAALARFGELTTLRLDHTGIGDAGLAQLAPLARLERLNLVATAVSDAGLATLINLRGLTKVWLWQSATSEDGLALLRTARPDLVVVGDVATVAVAPAPKIPTTCCEIAVANDLECTHPCCIEATARGEICLKCNPDAAPPAEEGR